MNELEFELDNSKVNDTIYLSKPFFKSIKKTRKELEYLYGIKIKKQKKTK